MLSSTTANQDLKAKEEATANKKTEEEANKATATALLQKLAAKQTQRADLVGTAAPVDPNSEEIKYKKLNGFGKGKGLLTRQALSANEPLAEAWGGAFATNRDVRDNIIALKAYCVAAAGTVKDKSMADDKRSALINFLLAFATDEGLTPKERAEVTAKHKEALQYDNTARRPHIDPVEQYQRLMARAYNTARVKYGSTNGLYLYVLKALHKGLGDPFGVLNRSKAQGLGGIVRLKAKAIGLSDAGWLKELAVGKEQYDAAYLTVSETKYVKVGEVAAQMHHVHHHHGDTDKFFGCLNSHWKARLPHRLTQPPRPPFTTPGPLTPDCH